MVGACSFGNDSGTSSPDASEQSHATCGDGVCAASEVDSCPADCGQGSGSGSSVGSGSGSGSITSFCGDGTCDANETTTSCSVDCPPDTGSGSGSGVTMLDCTDPAIQQACIACLGGTCVGVDLASCAASCLNL